MKESIKKLRDEIEAEKANLYIKEVGEELIKRYGDTAAAEKFLSTDKTIKGCIDSLRTAARAKGVVNQMAFLTPTEGEQLIRKYWGLDVGAAPTADPAAPIIMSLFD